MPRKLKRIGEVCSGTGETERSSEEEEARTVSLVEVRVKRPFLEAAIILEEMGKSDTSESWAVMRFKGNEVGSKQIIKRERKVQENPKHRAAKC